jgi:hypothetical protein
MSDLRGSRYPFDIAQVLIDIWNPDARTDTFDTGVTEAFKTYRSRRSVVHQSVAKSECPAFGTVERTYFDPSQVRE